MAKKSEITQKNFEKLLDWLDKDKEVAAQKYNSIHDRLVQIFLARNAFPADELADKTIDVAIKKIDSLSKEYEGDPMLYFYAVANNIYFQYLRTPKNEPLIENLPRKEEEDKSYYECLKKCMQSLLPEQRELLFEYFQYEKRTKIEHHKKMAEELKVDLNAIRTRVYRIRASLEECVQKCIPKKIV
jgi:DNA-directed RNA polymerase specialized sigma24 family protein